MTGWLFECPKGREVSPPPPTRKLCANKASPYTIRPPQAWSCKGTHEVGFSSVAPALRRPRTRTLTPGEIKIVTSGSIVSVSPCAMVISSRIWMTSPLCHLKASPDSAPRMRRGSASVVGQTSSFQVTSCPGSTCKVAEATPRTKSRATGSSPVKTRGTKTFPVAPLAISPCVSRTCTRTGQCPPAVGRRGAINIKARPGVGSSGSISPS